MGLEALQWDSLVRIAEEARARYVDFNDAKPGEYFCGRAAVEMGYDLYRSLGKRAFERHVACVVLSVTGESMGHTILVVGKGGKDIETRFEFGIKLDPTIHQFQQIHPQLRTLNRQCVFTDDYPKIYREGIKRDVFFQMELKKKIAEMS